MTSIKQPTSEVSKPPHPSMRIWNVMFPWMLSFFVSFTVFLIILVILPMEPWYAWKKVVAQYVTGGEYVVAEGGAMGENYFEIIVHDAYLKRPGWIVVSTVYNEMDIKCNEIFGKSDLLPAGKIHNATIRIPNIMPAELEDTTNQPALLPGAAVSVSLVYDNGSGDFINPIFVKDKTGLVIYAKTRIGIVK